MRLTVENGVTAEYKEIPKNLEEVPAPEGGDPISVRRKITKENKLTKVVEHHPPSNMAYTIARILSGSIKSLQFIMKP